MRKQGSSWGLWLATAISALIVLSGAYAEMTRRPANAQDELRIALQELRSQVEESGLLATHAKNGQPPREFVREHAHQLEKHMQTSVDDVRKKGDRAGRTEVGRDAAMRGEDALASLRRLRSQPATAATLDAIASKMESSSRELSRLLSAVPQPRR